MEQAVGLPKSRQIHLEGKMQVAAKQFHSGVI